MDKIDFKKTMKAFYLPSAKEPVLIDVPVMHFLMINGEGDPNTSVGYKQAIEALYGLAYTIKFAVKKGGGRPDYTVPPLEGLWWADDMNAFTAGKKDDWKWTMMIMQPGFISISDVEQGMAALKKKKELPRLDEIRLEHFNEGLSVQIMHIGPFDEEGPTIERLHKFAIDSGYELRDKHHELYISDYRRVDPAKMKIVIRQPVQIV